MTLLTRLFLLVGITLLPAIAIQAYSELDLRRTRMDEVTATTGRHVELMADELARIIDGGRQLVVALSQVESVRKLDSVRCNDLVERLKIQFPQYALIDVMDVGGQGMCAGEPGTRNNVADRAWFQRAVRNDGFAVGDYVFGKQSRRRSLHVAYPVHDDLGRLVGVVGAALDLDWLNRYMAEKPLPPGMALLIADRNGTLLARQPEAVETVGTAMPAAFMPLRGSREVGTLDTDAMDGVRRIVSHIALRGGAQGLFVAVGLDRELAFADVTKSTWRGMLLIAAGLVLAMVSAWLGARLLLRPVRALETAVARWAMGDLSARARLSGGRDELSALGHAFDAMADAVQDQAALRDQAHAAARKRAEVLDCTNDSVLEVDRDWRIAFMNERARTLLGGGHDFIGMDLWQAFPGAVGSAFEENARRVMEGGGAAEFEAFSTTHGRWYAVRAFPSREGFAAYLQDVTDRHNAGEALRAAKEEAERANLAKTKFLAAASHDLRQPIQSLFFFSAALARHVHDERGRDMLTMLDRGIDTLKGLLDSLLDVSRLDAGVIVPQVGDVALGPLLEHIGASYTPVAESKGLFFAVVLSGDVTVRSDATLLGRMVRNLVENAVRYTERGGVRLECVVEAGQARITVRDSGIGIPAEHLETIFQEFHQVANSERDRGQGLGLGLAIVKRLSRLLVHPVAVRSAPGQGSMFTVTVPLAPAAAQPVRGAVVAPAAPAAAGRFVVLIDDDAIVLLGLQAMFREWGCEVLIAGSAEQALERLRGKGRAPDLIVADYRLRAGRVGTEAILAIREQVGHVVPAVLLTGETGPECQQDATAHGLGIAHKPVTPRQLQGELERQLTMAAE
ncbi:ATP-binding protein [Azospirillum sp.]|uniref:ATP-binding protein n=1 Tax=Azospirillum sp. TaxID=34012 RepID=UPI002D3E475D|nr:ATP-binding protein [Azospirillum sp.]HYD64418.1 ATP-binding protein [Azospirillum sp.]